MKNQTLIGSCKTAVKRHPYIFMFCMVMALIAAGCYTQFTPALYESQVVVENPERNTPAEISLIPSGESAITAKITSASFLASAIGNQVTPVSCFVTQDLQKKYSSNSFPYEINYKILSENFKTQEYTIKEIDETQFVLMSDVYGISRSKTGKFDEELIDQNLSITLSRKKNKPYIGEELFIPAQFSFKIESVSQIAENLVSNRGWITASDKNGIITITCKQDNPILAQAIGAAIASSLLKQQVEQNNSTNENNKPFDEQLTTIAKQLESTEAEIAAYKSENNITDVEFETAKSLDVLKNLQLQKTELELEKAALDNTSKYLRKNRGENNSTVDYGAISDPVFSQQLSLLNEKYEMKSKDASNPAVDQEIESLKNLIAERILNTRKKNAIQLHKIKSEITAVQTELATFPEKSNILNNLDRKLALDKKVYDLLAEKRANALLTGAGVSGALNLIKPATLNLTPVWPINWMIVLIGLCVGMVIAFPVCIAAENLKQRKISISEAAERKTKIPFIGNITTISSTTKGVNESIAQLCTRILLQPNVKIITFASSDKGAGKTFISTRFAQAFAAMDKKVLVLDMNHSAAAVSEYFDVTPERSLVDVIEGKCDIHEAISITSYPNLDVLECGNLPAGVNSLLASSRRNSIFEDLKKHYDLIVTDTTDIGTQIDAIPMMKLSDLSLFVVRANTTRKQSLVAAEQIKSDYEILNLNFLLNSVTKKSGINTTRNSRVRNLNKNTEAPKTAYVPQMLRKIALWFY